MGLLTQFFGIPLQRVAGGCKQHIWPVLGGRLRAISTSRSLQISPCLSACVNQGRGGGAKDWAWPGLRLCLPTRAWLPAAFPAQAVEEEQSGWGNWLGGVTRAGRNSCPSSELLLKVGQGKGELYRKKLPGSRGGGEARRAGWGWGWGARGSTGLAANRNGNQARNPGGGRLQAGRGTEADLLEDMRKVSPPTCIYTSPLLWGRKQRFECRRKNMFTFALTQWS